MIVTLIYFHEKRLILYILFYFNLIIFFNTPKIYKIKIDTISSET